LGTPYAVVTDGDPNAGKGRTGADRVKALAKAVQDGGTHDPEDLGIFFGKLTFEADLFDASEANRTAMFDALESLSRTDRAREKVTESRDRSDFNGEDFLQLIPSVQKGRFAQRLASSAAQIDAPDYVGRALKHLMA
jgi:putative ATP-dependent endonuclease of OLD family